ncbi:MAG: class II aldolase/adducin family protein, partial [Acidimicrobiia bacterium]|nr:class II aldolase/adducin family protein [Acidimicrobiia bacterium]
MRTGTNSAGSQAMIDVLIDAQRSGLNRGTSGNASYRSGSGFVITPSPMRYGAMATSDLVAID